MKDTEWFYIETKFREQMKRLAEIVDNDREELKTCTNPGRMEFLRDRIVESQGAARAWDRALQIANSARN